MVMDQNGVREEVVCGAVGDGGERVCARVYEWGRWVLVKVLVIVWMGQEGGL